MNPTVDRLVVGAGCRGLATALELLRSGVEVLAVEAMPEPGGSTRTRRSEGYLCELGPAAMARADLVALLEPLRARPPIAESIATTGFAHNGRLLQPVAVAGEPAAPLAGFEAVIMAYRRELGARLRLGRRVEALRPARTGFEALLGGEVPGRFQAAEVDLCVGLDEAARLLAPFDAELMALQPRLRTEPRAFVFLGALAADVPHWRNYGILLEGADEPVLEVLFPCNAFAGRARPGKALARLECRGSLLELDDDGLAAAAAARLQQITGRGAPIRFQRVHRFTAAIHDPVRTEVQVRLSGLALRVPGLSLCG